MKSRTPKLKLESLDGRIVPSTVAFGDLNHDGLMDKAAITGNRTVTVSLGNANGGYTVAATLTAPNGTPSLTGVGMYDNDGDGDLDVVAGSSTNSWSYTTIWLNNGNGTFGSPSSGRFKSNNNWV
ncbi:MAG: FG-GAP repeat domain-containing protein [Gemmataceae bacterium]